MMNDKQISFPAFFFIWADFKGWNVPSFHVDICKWLERKGRVSVLEVFRGAAKSTITALYMAWKLRADPTYRFLVQSADDLTSSKMSADAQHVLSMHPLCIGMKGRLWQTIRFSVLGNPDHRNASVTAQGIMGNVTSSRANEVIFDDVEVPKNVMTPGLRETLRRRISDSTHILVPGGSKTYIGTPHTHDSLYEEEIKAGADALVIPLFDKNGKSVWSDYFTEEEIAFRRKECKTQNEWDSQYLLKARPLHEIRLDPDKIVPYQDMPVIRKANGQVALYIGGDRMIGCSTYWDVALGKADSDDSVFSAMFTNSKGHLFWQVADALTGEVDPQCEQICDKVEQFSIPGICIETNGPGGFVPAILRKHLKKRRLRCGVTEIHVTKNKTRRILDAFDTPLSGGFLHAHQSILDGKLPAQMRDWIPLNTNQKDDFIDSGAGAIHNTPVRIGKLVTEAQVLPFRDWRPGQGSHEVSVSYNRR
jgi:hypothetical protein